MVRLGQKGNIMKINKKKAGLAAGVAAAATVLIAPAAFAATTISVDGATTPVGNVTIGGSVVTPGVSFMTNFTAPISCSASTIGGYVGRGTVASAGTKIGAITNPTFSGCWGPNGPVIVKKNAKSGAPTEWPIHVVGTPAKGQVNIAIQIRNVSLKVHSTTPVVPSAGNKWSCYLKMQGTVNATFNQSTQQISINTAPSYPFAITAYDGASEAAQLVLPTTPTCGGFIYTGDTASMFSVFNVTTPGIGGIHL